MLKAIRNLFAATQEAQPARAAIGDPTPSAKPAAAAKPWKRGTYAEDMEPLRGARLWNSSGTFCRYCGDWITDSAFHAEHGGWHRPLRGSWNYENPKRKRRDPDDIKPGHQEWLEDMREYGRQMVASGSLLSSGTGPSIDPHADCAFHSEQEAQEVLSPFGMKLTYQGPSYIGEDGVYYIRDWCLSFDRKAITNGSEQ